MGKGNIVDVLNESPSLNRSMKWNGRRNGFVKGKNIKKNDGSSVGDGSKCYFKEQLGRVSIYRKLSNYRYEQWGETVYVITWAL